jgi:hypothetical protein
MVAVLDAVIRALCESVFDLGHDADSATGAREGSEPDER